MLVDTNILVYATVDTLPEHPRARAWLQSELSGSGGVALCWPVAYSLLRLITSTRAFGAAALSINRGWTVVAALLAQPGSRLVTAGAGHAAIAGQLVQTGGIRSADVPDVEIAALAIEHGLALATHDSGFRRFHQLRVVDPLV